MILPRRLSNDLLYPAWRGIDDGYKRKYARSIWQQFEDNIRSAAYTSDFGRFIDMLKRRLGIVFRAADVAAVAGAAALDPKPTLKCLREDTTLLVLMVRLKNDERKQAALEEKEMDEDLRVRNEDDGAQLDLA